MQGQTSGVRVNEQLECGNGETVFRNACKLGLLSADEYNRFVRWARRGVWENLFRELAGSGRSTDTQMIDSTHVKAHRSAAGGKRMARPVGKWFSQVAQTVCTNVPFGYAVRVPVLIRGTASRCHFPP